MEMYEINVAVFLITIAQANVDTNNGSPERFKYVLGVRGKPLQIDHKVKISKIKCPKLEWLYSTSVGFNRVYSVETKNKPWFTCYAEGLYLVTKVTIPNVTCADTGVQYRLHINGNPVQPYYMIYVRKANTSVWFVHHNRPCYPSCRYCNNKTDHVAKDAKLTTGCATRPFAPTNMSLVLYELTLLMVEEDDDGENLSVLKVSQFLTNSSIGKGQCLKPLQNRSFSYDVYFTSRDYRRGQVKLMCRLDIFINAELVNTLKTTRTICIIGRAAIANETIHLFRKNKVKLFCEHPSNPPIQLISWKKNGENSDLDTNNKYLIVGNITKSHVYICSFKYEKTNLSRYFTVTPFPEISPSKLVALRFTTRVPELVSSPRDDVVIPCSITKVTLMKSIKMTWTFQQNTIFEQFLQLANSSSDLRLNSTDFINGNYHLYISNANKSNGGEYVCTAKLKNKTIHTKTLLRVVEKPIVRVLQYKTPIVHGDHIILGCDVYGCSSNLQVKWYVGSKLLNAKAGCKDHIKVLVDKTIRTNNLTCFAGTNYSWATVPKFQVHYRPEINTSSDPKFIQLGKPLVLICKVDAYPPVQSVQWVFPSGETQGVSRPEAPNTFILRRRGLATAADAGSYTCKAENNIGGRQQVLTVKLAGGDSSQILLQILIGFLSVGVVAGVFWFFWFFIRRRHKRLARMEAHRRDPAVQDVNSQEEPSERTHKKPSSRMELHDRDYDERSHEPCPERRKKHKPQPQPLSPPSQSDPSTSDISVNGLELQLNTKLNSMPFCPQIMHVKQTLMDAAFPHADSKVVKKESPNESENIEQQTYYQDEETCKKSTRTKHKKRSSKKKTRR